jgi:radical SAM superfamily enzyme YgiQ (UPF0313 family)
VSTHPGAFIQTVAGIWQPTGLLYIAAVLQQDHHDVRVFDGALMTETQLMEQLIADPPEFIGISCVYPMWSRAKKLAEKLKPVFSNAFLAVGGQGPTYLKRRCLEECPAIDAVVVGEGEWIVSQMVRALEEHGDYTNIPGTIVKVKDVIFENEGTGIVPDLDALPYPAFSLIDVAKYRPSVGLFKRLPVLYTFSSRGCPNHCIYCSKIAGKQIRMKSPERIGAEVEYYVKTLGVKEIKFFDDLFTYDKERAMKICAEIKRRRLPLIWSASSRVDTIDRELARTMKESGCWYIHFGVESGVQKNLDTLRKGITLEQIRSTIRMAHDAGLCTFTTYILGIPGETYEEGRQTIRFACELNSLFSDFFCCTPFPGTELHTNISLYGVLKDDVDNVGMHLNAFQPFSMTETELEQLRSQAFVSFYLRWGNIVKQLRSIKSWQDIKYKWLGVKAIHSFRKYRSQCGCEQ